MDKRCKAAVYGWIRENYKQTFLDDIANIIYQFYLMTINSTILSLDEQISLLNLLFDRIKQESDIKSMNTTLLYRGSEHEFSSHKFHELCDNKGPTISIFHNKNNHVFGGYATQSFVKEGQTVDDTAFLWMIRPKAKIFEFKFKEKKSYKKIALWNNEWFGPKYGNGEDLWVGDCLKNNGCYSSAFKFDPHEICGGKKQGSEHSIYSFEVKDYEVFSVSFDQPLHSNKL